MPAETLARQALVVTVALSTVGLVRLVAAGYGLLSLAFVATFVVPLFTVRVWRLWKAGRHELAHQGRGGTLKLRGKT